MRLGKSLFVILAGLVAFSACNKDAPKTNTEQDMFLKKPLPASHVISSPFEGILLRNGKPVGEETLSIDPLEQCVGKTNIDVDNEGTMENFWFSAKTDPDLNSEEDDPDAL